MQPHHEHEASKRQMRAPLYWIWALSGFFWGIVGGNDLVPSSPGALASIEVSGIAGEVCAYDRLTVEWRVDEGDTYSCGRPVSEQNEANGAITPPCDVYVQLFVADDIPSQFLEKAPTSFLSPSNPTQADSVSESEVSGQPPSIGQWPGIHRWMGSRIGVKYTEPKKNDAPTLHCDVGGPTCEPQVVQLSWSQESRTVAIEFDRDTDTPSFQSVDSPGLWSSTNRSA